MTRRPPPPKGTALGYGGGSFDQKQCQAYVNLMGMDAFRRQTAHVSANKIPRVYEMHPAGYTIIERSKW